MHGSENIKNKTGSTPSTEERYDRSHSFPYKLNKKGLVLNAKCGAVHHVTDTSPSELWLHIYFSIKPFEFDFLCTYLKYISWISTSLITNVLHLHYNNPQVTGNIHFFILRIMKTRECSLWAYSQWNISDCWILNSKCNYDIF